MRRVLLDIVLPVLLARKLHHKRVRVTCLLFSSASSRLYATPRNLHLPEAPKKKGGGKQNTHYTHGQKKKKMNRNTNGNKSITFLSSMLFCRPPEEVVMYGFWDVGWMHWLRRSTMRLHVCHLRSFSGLSFAFSQDSSMDSGTTWTYVFDE